MTKAKCPLGHIHLIPADFEEYNLENLEMENENNDGVCWKNGNENGIDAQKFNLDDVVYIYFHDTRNITNRILLKASVCKTDNADDGSDGEYSQQYLYDDRKKIKGFYLNNFYAINEEYAHNNVFKCLHNFDIDEQNKETGILGVKINQTKRYLDNSDDEKVKNLLEKLEQPHLFSRKLKTLIQEFNDNVCQVCKGKEKSLNTFKKPNGLFYYEIHHVLMQNFNSIISNLSENEIKEKYPWYDKKTYGTNKKNILIYNNGFNEVRLCSKHHNELHYGEEHRKREILTSLVDDNYKKGLRKLVKSEKDYKAILKYIYLQYDLDYEEKDIVLNNK